MKKIILCLAIAILASLNMQAVTTKLTQKGDTSYIIEGKDTTILIKGIPAAIAKHINDTLVNNDKDSDSEVAGSDVIDKQGSNAKNEEALHKFMLEEEREQAQMAAGITAIVFFSIFAIIVVILLFNFLHRRAKYRVIEKAIDNNYPLSGTFMGQMTSPRATPLKRESSSARLRGSPSTNSQRRALLAGIQRQFHTHGSGIRTDAVLHVLRLNGNVRRMLNNSVHRHRQGGNHLQRPEERYRSRSATHDRREQQDPTASSVHPTTTACQQ
jgi:hypothetical protein